MATQSIAARGKTRPLDDFVDGQSLPEINKRIGYPSIHPAYIEDYRWAEEFYQAGDIIALVALYKNIPSYLQNDLNQLVAETYRKKLLTVPFLKASLLLLASGVLPAFQSLGERSMQFCSTGCLEDEQQKAIEFVSHRNPDDIIVMVLRSDRLIATMTLFPFSRQQDIPSMSYLKVDSCFEPLPDAPALEVGRLAKTTCDGYALEDFDHNFIDMASMAAAFIVSEHFVSNNGMLGDPHSFICGDTHGTLITSLKRFFPLTVLDSKINPDMLKSDNSARGMSIYFIQRQVLGSFESAAELIAAIQNVAISNPERANQIEMLLNSGIQTLGISSIHQFDPKRFRVHFFHFPFHHPGTRRGLRKMELMMSWIESRSSRPARILYLSPCRILPTEDGLKLNSLRTGESSAAGKKQKQAFCKTLNLHSVVDHSV